VGKGLVKPSLNFSKLVETISKPIEPPSKIWGRYYFDTFRKKAKEGENFKGNKNLNGNLGKSGFDTFRCKVGRN